MLNEYYGCQTVKDEDAIEHLEHCFTTKEFILDFIKQIREVTGSNEPLILAPTPTKGKTQSAKMGSCHWAVQKLVEQHLGRMFNCYTFGASIPQTFVKKIGQGEYWAIDDNYNVVTAYYHSLWQTPEENCVNVINYLKQMFDKEHIDKNKSPFIYQIVKTNYERPMLCLPVNENCSAKITNEYNITYQNLSYVSDRTKKFKEYPFWEWKENQQAELEIEYLPTDLILDPYKEVTDAINYKDYKNQIILVKNHEQDTVGKITDVNFYNEVKRKIPNYEIPRITNKVKEYLEKTIQILDTPKQVDNKMEKVINGNDFDFFCTSFSDKGINWSGRKDLFLEPSLVTKKYHYEIGNHLDYKPELEYKIVDKELVNKQVTDFITRMSESKKAYEHKRAKKKGLSLEDHILEQKFKLVS